MICGSWHRGKDKEIGKRENKDNEKERPHGGRGGLAEVREKSWSHGYLRLIGVVESVVGCADNLVALAGAGFKGGAVGDAEASSRVVDEAFALQTPGANGDGGATGTEDLGEIFLGEEQGIGLESVAGGEHPAGHALFDGVELGAEDGLSHLHHLNGDEGVDELCERSSLEELFAYGRESGAVG